MLKKANTQVIKQDLRHTYIDEASFEETSLYEKSNFDKFSDFLVNERQTVLASSPQIKESTGLRPIAIKQNF